MTDQERHRESVDYTDPKSSAWVAPISYDRHYSKRTMDDVLSSRYKARSANGEVIINPLSFTSENHLLQDDTCTYTRDRVPDVEFDVPDSASANIMRAVIGYVPQTNNIDGTPLDVDVDGEVELRQQLALSFVDEPQYGFGEDLFEIQETLRFLKNPLASIHKLLKAFDKNAIKALNRKGQVLSFARKAEAVAGVWATTSFALLPLIRSVEQAIEALNDKSSLSIRRTSRSKGVVLDRKVTTRAGSYSGISVLNIPPMGCTAEIVQTHTLSIHAGISYEAQQLGSVTEKLGLRNKDLLVTAWEVIPMSFMFDRIISVKNSIKSITNLIDPNVELLGGFVTKRNDVSYSIQLIDFEITGGDYENLTWSALPHISQDFTMTREKWDPSLTNALPIPNPVELVNGVAKVADLLSLIALTVFPLIRKYYVYR